ncbi:MAG: dihydropteroate synthase, partial [Gammaproteobacteria bacterium]|nr:dihydropteroate synthase [Gammaproteobacteria bacterium]
RMVLDGAVIIDVGGESTRPGADPVSVEAEINRVIPVIRLLKNHLDVKVSVDTSKPEVMRAAVAVGADLINDVRALQEPGALEAAAELNVPVCLMHMLEQPRSMQENPQYDDVVSEIIGFLKQRIDAAIEAGVDAAKLLVDPGFGFGKTLQHNVMLLKNLRQFEKLQLPLLVGVSRKRMIGEILNADVDQRVTGSVAAAVIAAMNGADILRVHDVKPTVDALKVVTAVA